VGADNRPSVRERRDIAIKLHRSPNQLKPFDETDRFIIVREAIGKWAARCNLNRNPEMPAPSDRRRSGRRDDARERNQRADIRVSNSRRHGPPIANQAPHRHRQANSGTCRGREPPHARHTFEVLPPETRPHKIDLSGRKSWCESDDPAFAAKAADIVRLYTGGPALHKKPSIVLDRHCLGFDQTVGFLQALEERNGSRSSLWA
jgi:hypothetical protein